MLTFFHFFIQSLIVCFISFNLLWSLDSPPKRFLSNHPPSIQVWFGPAASDDPEGLFYNLMRFMDSANDSLYFAIHDLNLVVVAQKLVELKKRGIKIKGILEADYLEDTDNKFTAKLLKKNKIPFKVHDKSGLMHNKYFIVDRKRVWTGSANFTERGYFYHYNDVLWIENKKVARYYLTDFKRLTDVRGYRKSGALGKKYFVALGDEAKEVIEIYFSPTDSPTQYLLKAIDTSTSELSFLIFAYSSSSICQAMEDAHDRDVFIRGIFDNAFSSLSVTRRWNTVPYNILKEKGIPVIYDDESAKVHHKMIVIDKKKVITGSFNFSKNAELNNNENVLVIHSKEIGQIYNDHFEILWKRFPQKSSWDNYYSQYQKARSKNPQIKSFWKTHKKKYYRKEARSFNKLINQGEFKGIMRRAVSGDAIEVEVPTIDSYITVKLAGVTKPSEKMSSVIALQETSILANQKPVRILAFWQLDGWLSCEGIVYFSKHSKGKIREVKQSLNEMMLKKGWGEFDLQEEIKMQSKNSPFYQFALKCKKAYLHARKLRRGIWQK